MDQLVLFQLLSTVLGGTTIVGAWISWKTRKAQIQITEGDAFQKMQEAYNTWIKDREKEYGDLRAKLDSQKTESAAAIANLQATHKTQMDNLKYDMIAMRKELEDYKTRCDQCPKNKQ